MTVRLGWALVLAAIAVVSCVGRQPDAAGTRAPLLIYAASDLQFALDELATAFAAAGHPRPTITFGSTGTLAQQIENGAPADVFFAADEAFVAGLEAKGLTLAGTRQLYAIGRIVLVERQGLAAVTRLEDLLRADVRKVSIANPEHAPYGRAAREALLRTENWTNVSDKIVLGENVSQAFQFVRTGNADAGIVALSLAIGAGARYTLVDGSLHDPIAQAAMVVARTRHSESARAFLAYVNGPLGRPVMKKYGFALPGEG